jgi:sugar lactone lactonase YvrE
LTRLLSADTAIAARCELAEGPVWDASRGVLYWVDILAGRVHSAGPGTGTHTWFDVGDPVGAVGLTTAEGTLVLALVDGFAVFDRDGGRLRRIPGFATDRSAVRFNDGKPDPWGNFCAGTMPWTDGEPGQAPQGALYRLAPDGTVTTMLPRIGLSNGLDWTDDHRTFFFADSISGGVDSFDCDPDTGGLGARTRFVEIPKEEGLPDGLTLDAEGCVWLAVFGSGELRRYTPDGRLDTVVRVPAAQVTSAAFGGDDLGTLFITTARENFTPAQAHAQPRAGDIFACTPGVPGRPPGRFASEMVASVSLMSQFE